MNFDLRFARAANIAAAGFGNVGVKCALGQKISFEFFGLGFQNFFINAAIPAVC